MQREILLFDELAFSFEEINLFLFINEFRNHKFNVLKNFIESFLYMVLWMIIANLRIIIIQQEN